MKRSGIKKQPIVNINGNMPNPGKFAFANVSINQMKTERMIFSSKLDLIIKCERKVKQLHRIDAQIVKLYDKLLY